MILTALIPMLVLASCGSGGGGGDSATGGSGTGGGTGGATATVGGITFPVATSAALDGLRFGGVDIGSPVSASYALTCPTSPITAEINITQAILPADSEFGFPTVQFKLFMFEDTSIHRWAIDSTGTLRELDAKILTFDHITIPVFHADATHAPRIVFSEVPVETNGIRMGWGFTSLAHPDPFISIGSLTTTPLAVRAELPAQVVPKLRVHQDTFFENPLPPGEARVHNHSDYYWRPGFGITDLYFGNIADGYDASRHWKRSDGGSG